MTASERRSQYLVETGRVEVEIPTRLGLIRRPKPSCRTAFPLRLKSLIDEMAAKHDVTAVELLSETKTSRNAAARRELIREMKNRFDYSASRIGLLLRLHHTTVLYHLKGMPAPVPFDPNTPDESGIWAI
jgi:hypothetical protein